MVEGLKSFNQRLLQTTHPPVSPSPCHLHPRRVLAAVGGKPQQDA